MAALTMHVLLSSTALRNVLYNASLESGYRKLPEPLTPDQVISELVTLALENDHDVEPLVEFRPLRS